MNIPAFKIGSGECNNYPLIEEILSYKKKECVPSVDKGGNNDGTIEFEFLKSNSQ